MHCVKHLVVGLVFDLAVPSVNSWLLQVRYPRFSGFCVRLLVV